MGEIGYPCEKKLNLERDFIPLTNGSGTETCATSPTGHMELNDSGVPFTNTFLMALVIGVLSVCPLGGA